MKSSIQAEPGASRGWIGGSGASRSRVRGGGWEHNASRMVRQIIQKYWHEFKHSGRGRGGQGLGRGFRGIKV